MPATGLTQFRPMLAVGVALLGISGDGVHADRQPPQNPPLPLLGGTMGALSLRLYLRNLALVLFSI